MTTPAEPVRNENTYVIDAENAAEMARLTNQDRLVTKAMGGLFPEQVDLADVQDILDIACGPGGWVLDVARAYPQKQVIGIDISNLMVEYAHYQAYTQGLQNARFKAMNALERFDFPDNSFDLVNARFLFGFMPPSAWESLLHECMRIIRPGGIIRLTEGEAGITNSSATEQITGMITHSLKLAGQSFSPDGRHTGITPVLSRLQRDAGYIDLKKRVHVMDYSTGEEAHTGMYQNFMAGYKLIQPFLIKMGATTQEEVDVLYQRMLAEMQAEDFCAIWFILTVWGRKPKRA